MKFLVDNQLPLKLAVYLQSRGHEATHVINLSLDEADDIDIWLRSVAEGFVLISKDEDFFFLAIGPDETGRLIWVRPGNCRNLALIEVFDQVLDDAIAALESGQRIVEIR